MRRSYDKKLSLQEIFGIAWHVAGGIRCLDHLLSSFLLRVVSEVLVCCRYVMCTVHFGVIVQFKVTSEQRAASVGNYTKQDPPGERVNNYINIAPVDRLISAQLLRRAYN